MNRWIAKIRFNYTIDTLKAYNLHFHGYIVQYH